MFDAAHKALIREERNKARQWLRKAKRNSSDPESNILEQRAEMLIKYRKHKFGRNVPRIFAAEALDDANDRSDVQPAFNKERAEEYFTYGT